MLVFGLISRTEWELAYLLLERETMGATANTKLVKRILDELLGKGHKLVFAESCTAGNVSAEFAKITGASNCLCGSFVTYRPKMKRRILGVKAKTIKKYTTESPQVVEEMAIGALEASGANWSAAVVGHFGPGAPPEKDGKIWVAIAKRVRASGKKSKNKPDKLKCKSIELPLEQRTRIARCKEATGLVLGFLDKSIFAAAATE